MTWDLRLQVGIAHSCMLQWRAADFNSLKRAMKNYQDILSIPEEGMDDDTLRVVTLGKGQASHNLGLLHGSMPAYINQMRDKIGNADE